MKENDDSLNNLLGAARRRADAKKQTRDEQEDDTLNALLNATRRHAKKRANAAPAASQRATGSQGLNPIDLLSLPRGQCRLLNWLLRSESAPFGEIQAALGMGDAELSEALQALKDAGYIGETLIEDVTYYHVILSDQAGRKARRRARNQDEHT
jgi:DNA-binding transcriptional ArsR family regulator